MGPILPSNMSTINKEGGYQIVGQSPEKWGPLCELEHRSPPPLTTHPACKLGSHLTLPSSDPSRQGLKEEEKPHTSLGKQSELFL